MNRYERILKEHLGKAYPGLRFAKGPKWLKAERWRPTFVLKSRSANRVLAVDLLLSGVIPRYQYRSIVCELLAEQEDLRVVIATLEENYEQVPELEEFCRRYRIGLKVIIPGVGVQTIVRTDLDGEEIKGRLEEEAGWFPEAILNTVVGLDKLVFCKLLDMFVDEVKRVGEDEEETRKLVLRTADALLARHPTFKGNVGQFMRLAHFENLLRFTTPAASEHVFHSFRVFLAGCPVLNRFYEEFCKAHRRFSVGDPRELCMEYSWLLCAIFHDIGRPKEGVAGMIRDEIGDEDLEVTVRGTSTRWTRPWNMDARRILGSLGAFVAGGPDVGSWDGGAVEDEEGLRISSDWIEIYDEMRSHGIVSAFDFLGDILKKARAAGEKRHRPFMLSHAGPAALGILLHDWRIWPEAKAWRLFPVDAAMLPMGALLIFLDTWDDYRRRGGQTAIHVKEYRVHKKGVRVRIEWGDSGELAKERVKYDAFRQALKKNRPFSLTIRAGMAGQI